MLADGLRHAVSGQLRAAAVLTRAGMVRPYRPDRLVRAGADLYRWRLSLPGAYAAAAALHPDAPAVIDDSGSVSFAELDQRTSALAVGLAEAGLGAGDRVAVLCRNHRGIIEATAALGKLGADTLYLNTSFARPQLQEVLRNEGVGALIHDDEFSPLVAGVLSPSRRFVAWGGNPRGRRPSLERLILAHAGEEPPRADRAGGVTILTSGTTGTPKGASRGGPENLDPAVAILSKIPLRARGTTLIASPIFHAWGLGNLGLVVTLSSTLVLQRQFEPERVLAAIEEHQVTSLAAVPVMLRQLLDLPRAARRRHDLSSLRVVAVSGSALPGELSTRFMDEFGDILHNLYGSTEVAWATIATPQDLRAAPGTAGRPPYSTTVRILDEQDRPAPDGATGRIFVANGMLFEGYTGGGGKDVVDGLMATGDMGRFDADGRLFIEGRDDDMLVTGGENVFPAEIEEVLTAHRDIQDAALIGVEDDTWGHRLHAFVVKRPGSRLTTEAVQEHVRHRLARFKVPREVTFVTALPRNPAGKVVKRELADGGGATTAPATVAKSRKPTAKPRSTARRGSRQRGRRSA